MFRMTATAFLVTLLAIVVGPVLAESDGDVPWDEKEEEKKGEEAKQETKLDLEAELTPTLYARAVKPLVAQTEQAEKYMEMYRKEMAEEKPNLKTTQRHQLRAAKAYKAIAARAQRSVLMLQKDEHKKAVEKQYKTPAKEKAVAIYLDLAEYALTHRDIRGGIQYYKMVLQVDPENTEAKKALQDIKKKIAQIIEERNQRRGSSGGGGTLEEEKKRTQEDPDQDPRDRDPRDRVRDKTDVPGEGVPGGPGL